MKKFHISQAHKKIGLDGSLPFWISMIKESQKIIKENTKKNVLDFGCGNGKFLQVFDLMDDLQDGLGIDLDEGLINKAMQDNINININYQISKETTLKKYESYFDIVYSQEVIYTIKDLSHHARNIFKVLKNGGCYFATMGSHIDNPLWSKRRGLIKKEEKYDVCDYSIEEVAEIFYNAKFEVGIKRLPVDYFLVYHPEKTKDFSNSLLDLTNTAYENKMLFCFFKHY